MIGAIAGGIISACISIGAQSVTGDKTINWSKVALDGTIGAISGLLSATGIGAVASAAISGVLGLAGSVRGDLIDSDGDWDQVNWGKAATVGIIGAIFGASKGSQNSVKLGENLLKNNEVKTQFGRLLNAVNDYAAGTISKRGMTGVFNLYGGQFIDAVSKALPRTVAGLTAKNLAGLFASSVVSSFAGSFF